MNRHNIILSKLLITLSMIANILILSLCTANSGILFYLTILSIITHILVIIIKVNNSYWYRSLLLILTLFYFNKIVFTSSYCIMIDSTIFNSLSHMLLPIFVLTAILYLLYNSILLEKKIINRDKGVY
jgi:hypothetical protein